MTIEQMCAWLHDPEVQAKYENYGAYTLHCKNVNLAQHNPASTPQIEVPTMTKPVDQAAVDAAIAQIKQWQAEDAQRPASGQPRRELSAIEREQAWRSEYAASPALQKEFRGVETWVSYKKAQHRGLAR